MVDWLSGGKNEEIPSRYQPFNKLTIFRNSDSRIASLERKIWGSPAFLFACYPNLLFLGRMQYKVNSDYSNYYFNGLKSFVINNIEAMACILQCNGWFSVQRNRNQLQFTPAIKSVTRMLKSWTAVSLNFLSTLKVNRIRFCPAEGRTHLVNSIASEAHKNIKCSAISIVEWDTYCNHIQYIFSI